MYSSIVSRVQAVEKTVSGEIQLLAEGGTASVDHKKTNAALLDSYSDDCATSAPELDFNLPFKSARCTCKWAT